MRGNSSSPHPTEDPTAPLIEADPFLEFLLTRHDQTHSFKASRDRAFLGSRSSVLSAIIYPAFYILTLVAKDTSLSIVRLIVSVWCSGVGFAL